MSIKPGATAFTQILYFPSSNANNILAATFTLTSASWATTNQVLNISNISSLSNLKLKIVGAGYNTGANPFVFLDNFKLERKSCPTSTITLYPPQEDGDDCVKQQKQFAKNNAFQLYKKQIDEADKDFREKFTKKCKASMEELKGSYTNQEHHYTLYYYDQAGNLIKTVPPEGVEVVNLSATLPNSNTTYEQAIEDDRVNNTHLVNTEHRMATKYEYNSLNQLINQYMPDHVNTESWNLNSKTGLPSSYQGKSVSFDPANPLLGYTVGKDASNNGQLFKTTDGGQSWSAVTQIGYGNINAIAETGSFFFAVTDAGKLLIYDTNNPGWVDNTNALPNNVTGSLNDIAFFPTQLQHGFIVGDNGAIYYTNNSGASFSLYNSNAPNVKLNKILPSNNFMMFLGNNGTIMHSTF
ncbi:MAG: hypothetical protein IPJ60_01670 [Sphingobacteriaceae bacterium]|nr:hypothetical protein [Sphingobacteriaceae bacterium]